MAETRTQRRPPVAKAPATRERRAAKKVGDGEHKTAVATTTELSEDLLRG